MSPRVMPTKAAARLATIVAAALLACVGITVGGPLPSTALLTTRASVGSSSVSSGSVSLGLSNGAATGSWTGSLSLVPGGSAYQRLTVSNTGSVALRYAATATSASDTLASVLQVGIVALAAGTTTCDSTAYAAGTLVSVSSFLPFGSTSGTNVIGDPAPGAQTGDRVLPSATSENLCLQVTFPFGTGLGYAGRGASATSTFTFSAENSP